MPQLPEKVNIYSFDLEGEKINVLTSNVNNILIDDLTKKIIDLGDIPKKDIIEKLSKNYSEDEIIKALEFLDNYIKNYSRKQQHEGNIRNSYLKYIISLHPSKKCNLNCKYCFREMENTDNQETDFSTVKEAIDFFVDNVGVNANKYCVDLSGSGEPLLRFDLIKQIHNYCMEKSKQIGKEILITFATNGTLLDDEKLDYLQNSNILFGISLDGSKEVQDDLRILSNGKGTYNQIMKNYKKIYPNRPLGFGVTLTGKHTNVKDIFLSLANLNLGDAISIKPVRALPDSEVAITKENIEDIKNSYKELALFLLGKARENNSHYLYLLVNGEDTFGKFIKNIITNKSVRGRCNAGRGRYSVDYNGDIYICPVAIGNEKFKIGNIYNGIDKKKQNVMEKYEVDNMKYCKDCWAKYLCGGQCYIVGDMIYGDVEETYDVLCEYKKFLIKLSLYFVQRLKKEAPEVYNQIYRLSMQKRYHAITDPGAFCLKKLADYWGIETSIDEIRRIGKLDQGGISPANLFTAAKQIGFEVKAAKAKPEHLTEELMLPAIAYINKREGFYYNHYVIIERISGNKITTVSPFGEKIYLVDDFCKSWSGILFFVEK